MNVSNIIGVPYTPSKIVLRAFNIIIKADVCTEGVLEWRRKPQVENTWSNVKINFAK